MGIFFYSSAQLIANRASAISFAVSNFFFFFSLLSSHPLLLLQMTLLQLTLLSMAVYDTAGSVQVMTPSDFSPSAHEITSGGQVISPSADVFLLLYMGSFLTLVRSQ